MTYYDRWRIVQTMAPLLLALVFVEVLGGQVLKSVESVWLAIPYLLAAFPAINAVGGNIASVISSRIGSALHTGSLAPTVRAGLAKDGAVGLGLGIVTYGALALLLLAQARVMGVGPASPMNLIVVVLVTGVLLTATLVLTAAVASVVSFQRGLDPDNLVIPIVTTVGDFAGIAYLFLIAGVML